MIQAQSHDSDFEESKTLGAVYRVRLSLDSDGKDFSLVRQGVYKGELDCLSKLF